MLDKKPNIADSLSTGSGRPKYLKLCEYLTSEIKAGRWMPGSILPTEQELTKQTEFSRNTVRQALAQLEKQKVVTRIRGKGTFVAGQEASHNLSDKPALSSLFAFVSPQLRTTIMSSVVSGFQEECARRQYDMLLAKTDNDLGRQADTIIQMLERKVGGIALLPTIIPTPAHQLRHIQNHRVPLVLCHRAVEGVSAPTVVINGYEVGFKLGENLLRLGHRRIGFAYFYPSSLIEDYQTGIRDALVQSGNDPSGLIATVYGPEELLPPFALNVQAQTDEQAIQKALNQLLSVPDPPTAIFCSNCELAEIVYLQLNGMGLEIPRDISLVVLRSTSPTSGFAGRMSGIGIPEHEIGTQAVRLLHEMHTGKRALDDNEQIIMPVSLLEGATLGPAQSKTNENKNKNRSGQKVH
jgi:GntR family transcriptional regulator, arabinose operon transcriptional repressor